MAARRKARKRALEVLFEADQRGLAPLDVLKDKILRADPPVGEYAVTVVEGVVEHQARIDEVLSTYSMAWPLDRMPAVDRALLRIGTWEVLYAADVPDHVAVSEAVEIAQELSTDESPKFVNGLLARIAELKETLSA
ncbi:N utilization substance protein B [Kineococcus radiotolerans]|uniref:Transcription antitermination protein NusB n=2 Tax=Kineococcus radiotolerans TaxID=131568 RepID=NUSB_KINRD|nr:transcription antitermination factor NusB [Kineococcus radiotolerans]A6WCD3.1 RecName: Full=Transcription antitermination protein NusB; AltName: Full=Antitermination factor NusB [Kineococcus radiotolerans SRS30216 = ATCC BAA-149]ABS04472.1 NusB antitermination factor [Kineococcus radiotolerans SRS30216 = ATCC BAA-149]MBB2902853.1 N utilization substance protein B [Kineococcus radiotolerans]